MKWTTKLFISIISFSWFMVFLSWRFAYPQDIVDHWIGLAVLITVAVLAIKVEKLNIKHIDRKLLRKLR